MDQGKILYDKGRAAMSSGRIADAIGYFKDSLTHYPHFKTFELLGECLMNIGHHKEAIGPLAAATALNRSIRGPSLLAEAFLVIGEMDKANQYAKLVLDKSPNNRRAKEVLKGAANQAL